MPEFTIVRTRVEEARVRAPSITEALQIVRGGEVPLDWDGLDPQLEVAPCAVCGHSAYECLCICGDCGGRHPCRCDRQVECQWCDAYPCRCRPDAV
jgi:hypothetical protein